MSCIVLIVGDNGEGNWWERLSLRHDVDRDGKYVNKDHDQLSQSDIAIAN